MCRITLSQSWQYHISNTDLQSRLNIQSIDFYIASRTLRWLGHVIRMPLYRLPRLVLTSWIQNPRPTGAPLMTYGRTINKHLRFFGLPAALSDWATIASDRPHWRSLINKPSHPDATYTAPPNDSSSTLYRESVTLRQASAAANGFGTRT